MELLFCREVIQPRHNGTASFQNTFTWRNSMIFFFHHCGKCLRFCFHMISIKPHSLSSNDFLSAKEPQLAMQIHNDQWQVSDLHHLVKVLWTLGASNAYVFSLLLAGGLKTLKLNFFGSKYSVVQCVKLKRPRTHFEHILNLSHTHKHFYAKLKRNLFWYTEVTVF